jgi:capsular exopolysaccharide synthesis family protein
MGKGLEQSATGVAFSIVEPASVPTAPYSPQRERLILMGLVAGLGLGLAMAFLIEQNDSTFGTVDDFQAFTRMPMLGVIPTVPAARKLKKAGRNAIVTLSEPESVPAEQYRILAMKVQQICANSGTRVVMITSAAGGEGKSTTAINLAAALSPLADGPVLLVDADMRKPRLHEYLGTTTAPSGRGFHSLLTKPTDDLAQYTARLGDLSVILGSAPTPNPIAALASPKVRALFDRLKQQFKLIIVDAPPTLPIADSHILSGLCDKVLFVVRSRRTARELFQHAVESFDAANVVGAVLNDVEYQRSRYAYAYEYYRENYLARK